MKKTMTNDKVQSSNDGAKGAVLICHCEERSDEAILEARGLPRTLRVLAMTRRGNAGK